MRRKDVGVIMKSCVAALSTAVVLAAMPAQVNAAPTKSVTVSTQKSLNAALKNSKVGTINIKTSKNVSLNIPNGKYTSKNVVMTASKAKLTNSGTLKGLYIKDAAAVTEKADNNKIGITDKSLKLTVKKGADNSKIYIGTKDSKVTVVADGKVASVSVSKKATVALTGNTTKPVAVTSTAAGTGLIISAKANVALKNTTTVTAKKGADLGTVTAYKNAILNVAKGAKVATLNSTGEKASVKVDADGTVGNVVLKKKATVAITGDTTKAVEVTNNASGSWVRLSAKANVKLNQPSTVSTYKGSDVGTITAKKDVIVRVGEGSKIGTVEATKNVTVNVGATASVKEVKSQGEDAKVTVNTNGTVGDVIIDKKAEVTVKGTTTTPVNVTSNAADSVVSVSAASKITLNESATVNVAEGAKVESLTAAKDVAVTVDAKAEVAEVVVKGEDAKVDVTANGTVGAVTVDAKAEVSIKGETDSSVVVNANVESAKINTEVKTEVNANANVDITLGEGAEGSKVVAGEDVNASVKNETKEDVTVTDSTGKENTVESGKTEDTKPAPETPSTPPVYVPSYSTYYVKDKNQLTEALEKANNGDLIVITANIGSVTAPEAENFGNYDITKAVTITSNDKQQVYGTFTILTDGVTINNLKITNRGDGDDKQKNAINIVASRATVTNCTIEVQKDHFGNGMCIYPTTTNVNYTIKGNTFGNIDNTVKPWTSTAIILSEGYPLAPRFSENGYTEGEYTANLTKETENSVKDYEFTESNWNVNMDEAIATGNTFSNCKNEYVHDDWYRYFKTEDHNGGWADYVYAYCVDGYSGTAFTKTNQVGAKMVVVPEKIDVDMGSNKKYGENVTIEIRKGTGDYKVTIGDGTETEKNLTITVNGTLIVDKDAKVVINDNNKLVALKLINNGTIKYSKSGLKNLLEAAAQYKYDGTVTENGVELKPYEYKSTNVQIKEKEDILQIVSIYDVLEPATIVEKFGDDMPRFLGAIYRSDGKNGIRVVNEIVFNDVTYVWKPERQLQGSNWRQKGTNDLEKTLVSAIKEYFMTNNTNPITIKIGDIDVQFVISRVES